MQENITVKIGADISALSRDLGKAQSDISGFGSKLGSIMQTVGTLAVAGGAIAGGAMLKLGSDAVTAAADVQATNAQFAQVFGDLGDEATVTLEAMGKEFGMLPERLKGPLSMTTSMFKGLGLSTEDALSTAAGAVTIAADAAAFYDKSYEDANAALNSFIKGNYEGGEAIGLFANETQLASWASKELGVDWKTLDEAGKQVARLKFAEAMQKSAGATGQASRESESLTNMQGNLKSAWTTLMAKLGEPILPMVIDWIKALSEKIAAVDTDKLIEDFKSFYDKGKEIVTMITDFVDKWTPLIAGIAAGAIAFGLITAAMKAYRAVVLIATTAQLFLNGALVANPIGLIVVAIGLLVAAGVYLWKNWDTISAKAKELWEIIKTKFSEIKEAITTKMSEIKSDLTAKWNEIKTSVTNKVLEILNDVISKFLLMKNKITAKVLETKMAIQQKWDEIKTAISNKVTAIKTAITNKFSEIKTAISNKMTEVKTTITEKWNAAKKFLTSIDLKQIGKDIIQGLINGISSMGQWVISAVSDLADLVPDWVKKKLGIKSPSRVLAKLGMYAGMGLAYGLDGETKSVAKSAQALANASIAKPTLAYDTPSASYGSLSSALSGSVDVSATEQSGLLRELIGAVREGRVVEMDGKIVTKIIGDRLNGQISGARRNGRG